jgi:hypothetical protein
MVSRSTRPVANRHVRVVVWIWVSGSHSDVVVTVAVPREVVISLSL